MKPKPILTNTPPHEIEIVIDLEGNFEATVLGITGTACEGISAFLDELGEVTIDQHTLDYFGDPKQTIKIKK